VILSQAVKNEAQRLGFSLAGITTPESPPHWSAYENWLAVGRHGSMEYLANERARQRRRDPRLILPECKSILVLAIRYPNPGAIPSATGLSGRVAAYAWGVDYHIVIPKRLRALVAFIEILTGSPVSNRWYTDTGPLLERDLAQRAGLGWIGKNTCLINPGAGSYFLLAEILLGIELEPDAPFSADRCGTCTRCIEACPTGCILADRTIDARSCISYLTIENKGEIPSDLRSKLGTWTFGCDICQIVCPWNKKAEGEVDPEFAPHPGVPHPDLAAELSLTAREFNRKFEYSPILRARRRGYLRNVAVALGNSGKTEATQALEMALTDEDLIVRAHAAWAKEKLQNPTGCQSEAKP
jgi:epoxyqueuosine reductase